MKDNLLFVLIIVAIISTALFGGIKNNKPITNQSDNQVPTPSERVMTQEEIARQLQSTQYKTEQLKKQIEAENEAKLASEYKGKISMIWGYGTTADQEYVELDSNYSNTEPINITGWLLISSSTGINITIPQSTNLYFANTKNANEDVWLSPGERAYIITGRSPVNSGMHVNICSGYLSQFKRFTPSLYTSCPAPRNEDLSSIPPYPNNDNCFDLINTLPACKIQTSTLNNSYSEQCQSFIYNKLNYPSCVDTHKDDKNFYSPKTWYVYMNRSGTLWKMKGEILNLYDRVGKKVYTIKR